MPKPGDGGSGEERGKAVALIREIPSSLVDGEGEGEADLRCWLR